MKKKLTKAEQIKRIQLIINRPEFITCENGHCYLPMSNEAEINCPICKNENYTENYWNRYIEYDTDDEKYFVDKYCSKDIFYDDEIT